MTSKTQKSCDEYFLQLKDCACSDRARIVHGIKRLQDALRRNSSGASEREHVEASIQQSHSKVAMRRAAVPDTHCPPELPITEHAAAIVEAIKSHAVVIIAGETGSGKSTQLPKLCLQAGRGGRGSIGCTQPRRVAARALTNRLREEISSSAPNVVGCKIRFSDSSHPDDLIKVMTDGVLLAEIYGDPKLTAYDTLIIDEAHERSLNIDFLLGYLQGLRRRRPDLKLIITSATIDVDRFSAFFDKAPVIRIPGRLYSVDVRYQPNENTDDDLAQRIANCTRELISTSDNGDILVFLPGEREIRDAADALRGLGSSRIEVVPLYARQNAMEQARIFTPGAKRRVVLATNVAETSLTIPRIRFVIDSGVARVSRSAKGGGIQRLPVEPISRASAEQRSGRCGRIGPGICVRMYSRDDFEARPEFTQPEIVRTNLTSVILRMKALGVGDVEKFPFLDAPDERQIKQAIRELTLIGALDDSERLTSTGKKMARFPVDPRFARIILAGAERACLREVLVIVSGLSIVDPRERPFEERKQADLSHAEFCDPESDFNALLNLWRFVETQSRHLSRRKFQALCRTRFLAFTRLQEWRSVLRELGEIAGVDKLNAQDQTASYEAVHRALLTGFVDRVANKQSQGFFVGMNNRKARIFPGSCLAAKPPSWIVAAEWLETRHVFTRFNARIDPQWVLESAAPFCRYRYFDPRLEGRSGRIRVARETRAFGLVLVPRQIVDYARYDAVQCRAVFIREGLVRYGLRAIPDFLRHNRDVVNRLGDLEAKLRIDGLIPDDQALADRYHSCLAPEVIDGPSLRRWLASCDVTKVDNLYLNEKLIREEAGVFLDADAFPDALDVGGLRVALSYRHGPGADDDGVTAHIPLAALNGLSPDVFDWQVLGYRREKILALIKGLAKQWRKNFVPVPQYAAACVAALGDARGPFLPAISAKLAAMTGVNVPVDAWQPNKLPDSLLVRFVLEDADGTVVAQGRDLQVLQHRFATQAKQQFDAHTSEQWNRGPLTQWDFADFPLDTVASAELLQGVVPGYPALVDVDGQVFLKVMESRDDAFASHALGLRRLVLIRLANKIKTLKRQFPRRDQLCLWYRTIGDCDTLLDDVACAVVSGLAPAPLGTIRSCAAFEEVVGRLEHEVVAAAFAMGETLTAILQPFEKARRDVADAADWGLGEALDDMRSQLDKLVFSHVFRDTGGDVLRHYPRYLRAISARVEKLRQDPQRDSRRAAQIGTLWADFWVSKFGSEPMQWANDPSHFRWLLEEFRVSLFAQELGAALPVSEKRLERMWVAMQAGTH